MNVLLYNAFNKRINSTKQPLPSQGANFSCQLKDECSFLNPVLRFSKDIVSGTFSPAAFNYVQIPYWQRFYYINDWEYKNGYWEASCSVDVLASFKYAIGGSSPYVLRSSYAYNGGIIDTFYPARSDVSITPVNLADAWYGVAPSGGSYIVGVINSAQSFKIGTLTYYAMTHSQIAAFMDFLYGSSIFNMSNITEIGEGLFKALFNPSQYIVSCMWFPFPIETFGSSMDYIKIGYYTATDLSQVVVVSNLSHKTFVTGTIPNHPQISRGSYLNHSPYTKITLYVPPFGSIPIDTNFLEMGRYLYCPVYIDHVTGLATMRINVCQSSSVLSENNVIGERTAQIGVPIQLSQVMPDYLGGLQDIGHALTSAVSGNAAGAISGILSAVDCQMPSVTSIGANGSYASTIQTATLIAEHLLLVDENLNEFGRPLMATKTISTIPGFIVCGNEDLSFSGTRSETEEINKFLKNGFFYE